MAKINFPKKQEQRLIPKYLLEYAEELQENHPDPSAEWGSQGTTYTAGEGIIIEDDTISVDTEDVAMVVNLATVAFSGSYNDLDNTPDLSVYELKEDAFSGDYNDLENKPTIPTKTSDLDNDSGFITGIDSSDVISALGYTPGTSNFDGDYNSLTNKPTFATVATTGDYDDLINKPVIPVVNYPVTDVKANGSSVLDGTVAKITIPTNVSDLNNDSGFITGITDTMITNALGYTPGTSNFDGAYSSLTGTPDLSIYATSASLSTVAFSGDYDDLLDKPTLATVAISGSYTDLTDKPTIPDTTYMVTTNTAQDITGKKTFKTNPIDVVNTSKGIQLHSGTNNSTSAKLGFTLYNSVAGSTNNEVGFLEANTNTSSGKLLALGYYNTATTTYYTNWDVGFALNEYNSNKGGNVAYKLVMPNQYNLNNYNTKRYIPIDFTDGTTTVRSDATGIVNISSLLPTVPTKVSQLTNDSGFITGITSSDVTTALGYTPGTSSFSGSYTDLTDKPSIPSSASSTSTVTASTTTAVTGTTTTTSTVVNGVTYTPSSETLTFTYDDDTTASFTFLTSSTTVSASTTSVVASVSDSTTTVMTGATVTTTTTLS